ncbi:predicted protein [Uncinocarpus reesii 1704]|uniref:Uncharacterized protein n=1 Tax=Uncinocarpus reesii (strain UAMH 1704) TaxID=336963 RepID=C4JGY6_UNCRE|nr:uncharacterized protein UREG_01237 [Uncinocarpus reesii 1704]EEP76388.1 predicted protein [Uncinocarpus reesii 1704]
MAPSPFAAGAAKPNLSSNDSKVLQALFDAESSPSPASSTAQTDESLPPLPHISESELPALQEREIQAIRRIQTTDASPSIDAIKTTISELSALITDHPKYASAYVNRAQAYRLLVDAESKEPSSSSLSAPATTPTPVSQIFSDLADAITLLTPNTPTSPVSPLQARILANAYTHRAYILYKAARTDPSSADGRNQFLPPTLQDASDDRLEELASFDFQAGGRYGNPVAKQMAVHTNPYAKMCGAIVKDAMKAEIKEWADLR